MRKLSIATLAVALALVCAGTVNAQPRQPSFGRAVANGAGFELGRRLVGGFARGGFYGGSDAALLRELRIQRQLQFNQLRQFSGGHYGGQRLIIGQSYYTPAPIVVDQAPLLGLSDGCGTLGLSAGYSYGALGLGGYGGCGTTGQFLRFIR